MDDIIARKIILVDNDGKAKIILDADNDGYAKIEVITKKERLWIQESNDDKVTLCIDRIPNLGVVQLGTEGIIVLNPKH